LVETVEQSSRGALLEGMVVSGGVRRGGGVEREGREGVGTWTL